jgi:hypothetical protein
MKKFSILVAVVLLFATAFAVSDEATLIDFTLLETDEGKARTAVDYSVVSPVSYTEDQKAALQSSLALGNWEVVLNSSAINSASLQASGTRAVPVKDLPVVPEYFRGKSVLGVRILFPTAAANAQARIVPPFNIPAFQKINEEDPDTAPTKFEEGYGVVKNVGAIKEISVRVRGNVFPHYLYVLLEDQDGIEHRYPIGSLNFEGWKTLSWKNPAYISDVRKRALEEHPLYPNTDRPFVKFVGFWITKDAMNVGGDFISYFGDVRLIYDKAVIEKDSDIDEEAEWSIIKTREAQKQTAEMVRTGAKQILQAAEKEKIAAEDSFATIDTQEQQ